MAEPWAVLFRGISLAGSQRSVPAAGNGLFPVLGPKRVGLGSGSRSPTSAQRSGEVGCCLPTRLGGLIVLVLPLVGRGEGARCCTCSL